MAQYYTLEEAARVLQTTADDVRRMADEKKVRSFRDKGTLRFRAQEIDELARQMGLGSDMDLQLGEVPAPKKGSSPAPTKRPSRLDPPSGSKKKGSSQLDLGASKPKRASKMAPPDSGEVFDFSLSLDEEEAQVQLGSLPPPSVSSSKSGKKSSPPSPSPKPGSDSDVRLVNDGSDLDFNIPLDDDQPAPPSPVPGPRTPPTGRKNSKRASQLGSDSGVRIVPLDPSDSDLKMVPEDREDVVQLGGGKPKSASDSDIRLEHLPGGKRKDDESMVTEEIDLDAELGSFDDAPGRPGLGTPSLPTDSPFELSEEDLDLDEESSGVSDSSGDFELTPEGDMSPLELGSDEMPALRMEEEEVTLGDLSDAGPAGSGVNLDEPGDGGISLEKDDEGSSDDIDFELSLDGSATPPPSKKKDDSSSEFELSLDEDESSATISSESSEFELSLDDSGSSELELDLEPADVGGPASDSDSEFELTLDDSGASSPLDDDSSSDEDKDIFATDFDVPALDEESGSQAMALDDDANELEDSSDFDLAIDELDSGTEDESGSQVIALDDEDPADPDASTQQRKKPKTRMVQPADEDEEDGNDNFVGIGPGDEDEDEEELEVVGKRGAAVAVEKPAAPWGPVPVILMAPCVLVLFVIGLLGFEMVNGMVTYQRTGKFSGLLIGKLTEMVTGESLPGSTKKK